MLALLLCPYLSPPFYTFIIPYIGYKIKHLFILLQTKIEPTNLDII
nr:MAG TPA: hypothetical protein [Caudoviricetes sp.]DAU86579.1 MAG TPA: hypothetical protein [Caudoviricetes sp.]